MAITQCLPTRPLLDLAILTEVMTSLPTTLMMCGTAPTLTVGARTPKMLVGAPTAPFAGQQDQPKSELGMMATMSFLFLSASGLSHLYDLPSRPLSCHSV